MNSLYKKDARQFSVEQTYSDFMKAVTTSSGELYSEIATQLSEYVGSFIYFMGSNDLCIIHYNDKNKLTIAKQGGVQSVTEDRTTKKFLTISSDGHSVKINPDYISSISQTITLGNARNGAGATLTVIPSQQKIVARSSKEITAEIAVGGTVRRALAVNSNTVALGADYSPNAVTIANGVTVGSLLNSLDKHSSEITALQNEQEAAKRHVSIYSSLTTASPLSYEEFKFSPKNFTISMYFTHSQSADVYSFELSPNGSDKPYTRYYLGANADSKSADTYYNIYKQIGGSSELQPYLYNKKIAGNDEIIVILSAAAEDYIAENTDKGDAGLVIKDIKLVDSPDKITKNGVYAVKTGLHYVTSLSSNPSTSEKFCYYLYLLREHTAEGRFYNINRASEIADNDLQVRIQFTPYAIIQINDFCSRVVRGNNTIGGKSNNNFGLVWSERLNNMMYERKNYAAGQSPEHTLWYGDPKMFCTMDGAANVNNPGVLSRIDLSNSSQISNSMYADFFKNYGEYNKAVGVDKLGISPVFMPKSKLFGETSILKVRDFRNGIVGTSHLFEETYIKSTGTTAGSWTYRPNYSLQITEKDTVSSVYSRAAWLRDFKASNFVADISKLPLLPIYYSVDGGNTWTKYNNVDKISVPPQIHDILVRVPLVNYTSMVGISPFFVLAPAYAGSVTGQASARFRGVDIDLVDKDGLVNFKRAVNAIMNNVYTAMYPSESSADRWGDSTGYFLKNPGILYGWALMLAANMSHNESTGKLTVTDNRYVSDPVGWARLINEVYATYHLTIENSQRMTQQIMTIPYVAVLPSSCSDVTPQIELDAPVWITRPCGFLSTFTVKLNNPNSVGCIRYTVNGSAVTEASAMYVNGGIPLSETTTVRAAVFYNSYRSEEIEAIFQKAPTNAEPPVIHVGAYSGLDTFTIDSNEADVSFERNADSDVVYYTLNGTTPTINSARYTTSIRVTSDCTVKAIARNTSGVTSGVVTGKVVLLGNVGSGAIPAVPAVSVYSSSGVLIDNAAVANKIIENITSYCDVKCTSADTSAAIYYTLNGEMPSLADSTVVSGDSVRVTNSCVFVAATYRNGIWSTPISRILQFKTPDYGEINNTPSASVDPTLIEFNSTNLSRSYKVTLTGVNIGADYTVSHDYISRGLTISGTKVNSDVRIEPVENGDVMEGSNRTCVFTITLLPGLITAGGTLGNGTITSVDGTEYTFNSTRSTLTNNTVVAAGKQFMAGIIKWMFSKGDKTYSCTTAITYSQI